MHYCEMRKYQVAVFSIFLIIASACFAYDFAGGTGEPNDPYQIETAAQLLQLGSDPNLLDKCYILNNDIDLDPNVIGIPPFTQAPIAPDINNSETGFQGNPFTGTFDHSLINPLFGDLVPDIVSSCYVEFFFIIAECYTQGRTVHEN